MILQQHTSWFSEVLVIRGSVMRSMTFPILGYLLYTTSIYVIGLYIEADVILYDEGQSVKFLSGFVSFLFIWRLNQCYSRYETGNEMTARFFSALHSMAGISCSYLRGSDALSLVSNDELPENSQLLDALATVVRVNAVRLILATAIAFKYHCRVAENAASGDALNRRQVPGVLFDLLRLRGLLHTNEQTIVEECCGLRVFERRRATMRRLSHWVNSGGESPTDLCALPVLFFQLLRDVFAQASNQKWGYPERILNLLEAHMMEIASAFEQLDRLITIPLPLAYLQHCKLLFLIFVIIYPLTIRTEHGIWANIFSPTILFFALLGFEVLADEMQNPIGDDTLDLNILHMISELEGRLCEIFTVTDVRRLELRESFGRTLQDMEVSIAKGTPNIVSKSTSSIGMRNTQVLCNMFIKNFEWIPYPAHILAYCAEKEHGTGDSLLRKVGLNRPARSTCCSDAARALTDEEITTREEVLREEAQAMNLTTHFMCLRSQSAETTMGCTLQLVEELELQGPDTQMSYSRVSSHDLGMI